MDPKEKVARQRLSVLQLAEAHPVKKRRRNEHLASQEGYK